MAETDPLVHDAWRKSSFSGGGSNGGNTCVEIAFLVGGRAAVRDSKSPGYGPLSFPRARLDALISDVTARRS